MAEREPEDVGRRGGAAEHYMGVHPYYEPYVTAVTDLVVPATRIQWGPIFAGLVIALSVTFLWTALGIALGYGMPGLAYWIVGFACLGLFLGSMFAARTARAGLLPAIMHAVIIWAILMIIDVFAFGGLGASLVGAIVGSPAGAPATTAAAGAAAARGFGWWFFGGFLVMLAASILGGIAGMNPPEHHEEAATPRP